MPELPVVGEWWRHTSGYLNYYRDPAKGPEFIVNDVIVKEDIHDSWIIYSNNDLSDYFVVPYYEWVNEWEKVEEERPALITWETV